MVADTACFTHAGCGNDDLGFCIKVDRHGIIGGDCHSQSAEFQRVDAFLYQFHCGCVITVHIVGNENFCCLDGQRAVHIYFKAVMTCYQIAFFDLSDEIQHFLGPANGKGRNDQIAALVEGFLDMFRQFCYIVRGHGMITVAVCVFHNDIVCLCSIAGIMDDGLIDIADVAGINDFLCDIAFCQPDLDTGRT